MVQGTALYISLGILITLFVGGPVLWYLNKVQEQGRKDSEEERVENQGQELTGLQQDRDRLQTCQIDLESLEGERYQLLTRLTAKDAELQQNHEYISDLEATVQSIERQRTEDEEKLRLLQVEYEEKLRLRQEEYDYTVQQYRSLAAE